MAVAVVTGAGGGIGRAIVRHLSEAGHTVAACDLNPAAAAEAIDGLPGPARAYPMDIADSASVAATVADIVRDLGPVGVLVNNAGIDKIEPFVESTEQTWRKVVEVNYLGTVIVTRAVVDGMLAAGGGRIINISSDAGRVGSSGEVVYSGTKGAVIAFGKALAREVARSGVTVNSVCPGPTDTPLLQQVADRSQKLFDAMARSVPMKRIGTPDAGRVGSSGEVVYSGTKGAVIAFGKALAREVAHSGVTVNSVCPGPTDTPLLQQVADRSQKLFDAMARSVPMKRIGTPDDVAPAVVFFASPGAAFITGQTLSVSGGLTMA